MSEWINVNDRLPLVDVGTLLVVIKDGDTLSIDTDSFKDGWFTFYGRQPQLIVTHWFELPELPEQ